MMIRTILVAGSLALALAACDQPAPEEPTPLPEAPMEPMAPAAPDAGAPVVAPSATDTPPVDNTALPPEQRSSEESVKPESETLFY